MKRSQVSKNTSFCISSCTHEKIWPPQARAPRSLTPPNLSESDKRLVLTLGLEEAYKRMAPNHKFHIDVAAGQPCLEWADQVLCSMQKAAEHEYACLMRQDLGMVESDEEEEEEGNEEEEEGEGDDEEENIRSKECGHLAPS